MKVKIRIKIGITKCKIEVKFLQKYKKLSVYSIGMSGSNCIYTVF